jgi:tight adherence protein E
MFKLKKQKGVSTIEFAIGFIFFWYMCAAWVEISFMSYISATGDLAISRASQVAKTNEGDISEFLTSFTTILQQDDSLWRYLSNSNSFSVSIQYLDTFDDLSTYDGSCVVADGESSAECGDADGAAIALYRLDYSYDPVFNLFLTDERIFSREMIVIQEYQRSEF